MKGYGIFSLAAALVFVGCATQNQVARQQGFGTSRTYTATYDQAWRATVDASQQDGLQVITADRASGYISARRTVRAHTFGENVGIWIREVAPSETRVEVVSRQAGPPVAWLKNWENEIHRAIAANLTRDNTAVGTAPGDVLIERGATSSTIVVPESRETVVVPEKRETILVPETPASHEALTEQQRVIETLKLKQDTGQRALANEVDETKREMLQREVNRLREDLRLQEQRLKDLEKQLKR
jgi:hypothetical protein